MGNRTRNQLLQVERERVQTHHLVEGPSVMLLSSHPTKLIVW